MRDLWRGAGGRPKSLAEERRRAAAAVPFYAHWSDNGRSCRRSMGTSDAAEAQRRFADFLLLQGKPADPANLSVSDCWRVYEKKHIDAGGVAGPDTLRYNWKALEPHFGPLLVADVDQAAVDAYVDKRTSGHLGRKVKPQTCRKEIQALFAALRFCAAKPQAMFSATIIETVKLPEAGAARERWLRMDEMQRLLDAAARLRRGPRLSRGERFLWLALNTAGRMTAILELTWGRVDFDTRTIDLRVPGRRETKKRRAVVPISSALLPILRRAHEERINEFVVDNPANVWSTVQLIAIEAGFGGERPKALRSEKPKATGISPHVLRHTAATHMARNGVPLWKVAQILGDTLATTEKTYAKWCPDDPAGTVDMIGAGKLETAG